MLIKNTITVKQVTLPMLSISPLPKQATGKSHLVMSAVQNKIDQTPKGSFCMLVLLTASILDRLGIR